MNRTIFKNGKRIYKWHKAPNDSLPLLVVNGSKNMEVKELDSTRSIETKSLGRDFAQTSNLHQNGCAGDSHTNCQALIYLLNGQQKGRYPEENSETDIR